MQYYHINWILFVLLIAHSTYTQRTYMRTCDCEYVVDGKCAYTLLLPMDKNAAPQTCENQQQTLPQNMAESIQSRLQDLSGNVSNLNTWINEHARMLNQLQSSVIGLSQGGPVNPDGPTNPVGFDNTTLDLIRHAHEQNTRIGALEMQLASMQVQNSKYSTDIEVLRYNITQLANNIEALSKSINSSAKDISRHDASIDSLSSVATIVQNRLGHLMCLEKGLLVTGTKIYVDSANIKVSSQFDTTHGPNQARINNTGVPGAWCPAEPNLDEWIQLDLGAPRTIYAVVTRGRPDYPQWVTRYLLQYTEVLADDPSETVWVTYKDLLGDDLVFEGNSDQSTKKINDLWQPIRVRYIRIVPTAAHQDSNKCMRVDLLGCVDSP